MYSTVHFPARVFVLLNQMLRGRSSSTVSKAIMMGMQTCYGILDQSSGCELVCLQFQKLDSQAKGSASRTRLLSSTKLGHLNEMVLYCSLGSSRLPWEDLRFRDFFGGQTDEEPLRI